MRSTAFSGVWVTGFTALHRRHPGTAPSRLKLHSILIWQYSRIMLNLQQKHADAVVLRWAVLAPHKQPLSILPAMLSDGQGQIRQGSTMQSELF